MHSIARVRNLSPDNDAICEEAPEIVRIKRCPGNFVPMSHTKSAAILAGGRSHASSVQIKGLQLEVEFRPAEQRRELLHGYCQRHEQMVSNEGVRRHGHKTDPQGARSAA